MSRKILTEQRNADIYHDFLKEFEKGFRHDVICDKLSAKYYMTAKTIGGIVTQQARKTKTVESGKEVP